MLLFLPTFQLTAVFMFLFIACELPERGFNKYNEIDYVIGQFKTYLFPDKKTFTNSHSYLSKRAHKIVFGSKFLSIKEVHKSRPVKTKIYRIWAELMRRIELNAWSVDWSSGFPHIRDLYKCAHYITFWHMVFASLFNLIGRFLGIENDVHECIFFVNQILIAPSLYLVHE